MMNKNEWKKVKLGDIFDLQMGKTPSRNNRNYWENGTNNWISISDIKENEKYIEKTKEKITDIAIQESKIKCIPKNTVIMSFKLSVGKVAITSKDIYTNEAVVAFLPKNLNIIDNNYLYYFLPKINWSKGINKAVKGLTLNKPLISNKVISFPDLQTQKQIAEKLDLLSYILNLKKKQLFELEKLVKFQFLKMFDLPNSNKYNFKLGTIRDYVSSIQYGTSKPATLNGRYKYLRMNNITYDGYLDISDLKTIDLSDSEFEKFSVKYGDVLFNRTNSPELVGKTCVFNLNTPMIIAGYIIKVQLNNKVLPEYISTMLNTSYGKKILYNISKKSIGQANINAQELQNIKILIPPIELQNKFAEFVKQVDKSKVELQKSIDETQLLFDSLMDRYFG